MPPSIGRRERYGARNIIPLTESGMSRTHLRSRANVSMYALASALLAVACGTASTTGPASLAGKYVLRTINGIELPAAISRDAARTIEAVSGELILQADGAFTGSTIVRETLGGEAPTLREVRGAGHYSVTDSTLLLTNTATGTTTTLVIRGDVIRYISDLGAAYELQRATVAGESAP